VPVVVGVLGIRTFSDISGPFGLSDIRTFSFSSDSFWSVFSFSWNVSHKMTCHSCMVDRSPFLNACPVTFNSDLSILAGQIYVKNVKHRPRQESDLKIDLSK